MSKILSKEECKAEYLATMDRMSTVANFQYTLIATLLYIAIMTSISPSSTETFPLLGLDLSRFAWTISATGGLTIINIYMTRMLIHLTRLYGMYKSNYRQLRFLTWHNRWLFNPFRSSIILDIPKGRGRSYPKLSKKLGTKKLFVRLPAISLYLPILLIPSILVTQIVDFESIYQGLSGVNYWSAYILVSGIVLSSVVSAFALYAFIHAFRVILWYARSKGRR